VNDSETATNGEPVTGGTGGRVGGLEPCEDFPRPARRRRRETASAGPVLSPEEWGRREAARAPRWSLEQRSQAAGMFGLMLPDNAVPADGERENDDGRSPERGSTP